jgi:cell division protein FtsL
MIDNYSMSESIFYETEYPINTTNPTKEVDQNVMKPVTTRSTKVWLMIIYIILIVVFLFLIISEVKGICKER